MVKRGTRQVKSSQVKTGDYLRSRAITLFFHCQNSIKPSFTYIYSGISETLINLKNFPYKFSSAFKPQFKPLSPTKKSFLWLWMAVSDLRTTAPRVANAQDITVITLPLRKNRYLKFH